MKLQVRPFEGMLALINRMTENSGHFLLIFISGNKSTIPSSESFEKTVLEISHKVHDVVSKTRRT